MTNILLKIRCVYCFEATNCLKIKSSKKIEKQSTFWKKLFVFHFTVFLSQKRAELSSIPKLPSVPKLINPPTQALVRFRYRKLFVTNTKASNPSFSVWKWIRWQLSHSSLPFNRNRKHFPAQSHPWTTSTSNHSAFPTNLQTKLF